MSFSDGDFNFSGDVIKWVLWFIIYIVFISLISRLSVFTLICMVVAIFLLYLLYGYFTQKQEIIPMRDERQDPITQDIIPQEKKAIFVARRFKHVDTDVEIEDEKEIKMTYQKFKGLISDDSFIDSFAKSLKISNAIKREKYYLIRQQFLNEQKSLDGTVENKRALDFAIDKIDSILDKISLRQINRESVRSGLYRAIYDSKNGMETLLARDEIKDFLSERLYNFSLNPRIFVDRFQNIRIYAGSGYGKTKLANVIAHVFSSSMILIDGNVVQGTKTTLVSPYINSTAPKTRAVLISSLESILFIDEAYNIVQKTFYANASDHGNEAVVEIVNFLDKMIGLHILIVAGYQKQMEDDFFGANEGLHRRFLPAIILKAYSSEQLSNILIGFLLETNPTLKIKQDHANFIYSLICSYQKDNSKIFHKQAGDMLNLSDKISQRVYLGSWEIKYREIIKGGFENFIQE